MHIFQELPYWDEVIDPEKAAKRTIESATFNEILANDCKYFKDEACYNHVPLELILDTKNPEVFLDEDMMIMHVGLKFDYKGNFSLFRWKPSPSLDEKYYTTWDKINGCVFVYLPPKKEGYGEELSTKRGELIDYVETQYSTLQENLNQYESEIRKHTEELYQDRYEVVKNRNEVYNGFDFEVNRNLDVDNRMKIDVPKRNKPIKVTTNDDGEQFPTISQKSYFEILDAVYAVGYELQKAPNTYSEFNEEDLRNVFLVFLELNFGGSATGETFNMNGKADIVLKHNSQNVLIAECGIWNGPDSLKSKISQLLDRYVTWQDQKTAVIMFVRDEDMENIREKFLPTIENHSNFKRVDNQRERTWWQCTFDRPGDSKNEIQLGIMVFNIPKN